MVRISTTDKKVINIRENDFIEMVINAHTIVYQRPNGKKVTIRLPNSNEFIRPKGQKTVWSRGSWQNRPAQENPIAKKESPTLHTSTCKDIKSNKISISTNTELSAITPWCYSQKSVQIDHNTTKKQEEAVVFDDSSNSSMISLEIQSCPTVILISAYTEPDIPKYESLKELPKYDYIVDGSKPLIEDLKMVNLEKITITNLADIKESLFYDQFKKSSTDYGFTDNFSYEQWKKERIENLNFEPRKEKYTDQEIQSKLAMITSQGSSDGWTDEEEEELEYHKKRLKWARDGVIDYDSDE